MTDTEQKAVPTKPAGNRRFEFLRKLLRKVITIYIVVIIVLGFLQRSLLYHPSTAESLPVASVPGLVTLYPAAQDVEIACESGQKVRGWLLKKSGVDAADERPLVIYFHGNAGNRAGRGPWYQVLESCNVDVLAIDYLGYGDSEGKVTESTLEISCDAAWAYATETLGYRPNQIVIGGTSLGGAAAVYLCSKQCVAGECPNGLFVVATFSSMVDVASNLYWWLPVRAVLVDRYPSDERAAKITCPVVVMHGDQDTLVRQHLGQKLFDAFPAASTNNIPKRWVNLPDTGHNDLLFASPRLIRDEIEKLLNSI